MSTILPVALEYMFLEMHFKPETVNFHAPLTVLP